MDQLAAGIIRPAAAGNGKRNGNGRRSPGSQPAHTIDQNLPVDRLSRLLEVARVHTGSQHVARSTKGSARLTTWPWTWNVRLYDGACDAGVVLAE